MKTTKPNKTTKPKVEIINYSSALAPFFYNINAQWINDMFVLEEIDKEVLGNPQHFIIDNGGYIWFAKASIEMQTHESNPVLDNPKSKGAELVDPSEVVGTCALLKRGDGAYELTKMGVLSSARGLKVGEILLQQVIEQAKRLQVKDLFLLTNKNCEAAIHLYEKNGFIHSKRIMEKYGAMYSRCDVAMEYVLPA